MLGQELLKESFQPPRQRRQALCISGHIAWLSWGFRMVQLVFWWCSGALDVTLLRLRFSDFAGLET